MIPRDTSADAWARHIAGLRAMQPEERLRLALSASEAVRNLARSGIRFRHPDWDDDRVQAAFEVMMVGDHLARVAREARLRVRG